MTKNNNGLGDWLGIFMATFFVFVFFASFGYYLMGAILSFVFVFYCLYKVLEK